LIRLQSKKANAEITYVENHDTSSFVLSYITRKVYFPWDKELPEGI